MRLKWWYSIVAVAIVIVLLLYRFNKHRPSSRQLLSDIPLNPYQQQIVRGQVTSWDTATGRLMLWANNKNWEIMVDPAQMTVFTASQLNPATMYPVLFISCRCPHRARRFS